MKTIEIDPKILDCARHKWLEKDSGFLHFSDYLLSFGIISYDYSPELFESGKHIYIITYENENEFLRFILSVS
jgi:hypothetical protein